MELQTLQCSANVPADIVPKLTEPLHTGGMYVLNAFSKSNKPTKKVTNCPKKHLVTALHCWLAPFLQEEPLSAASPFVMETMPGEHL